MKDETVLTVEQVDKELAELEAKHGHKLSLVSPETGAPTAAAFCAAIVLAVPILKFAKACFFFKHAWQLKIQNLIDKAGLACP